jgi:hypothetical protein
MAGAYYDLTAANAALKELYDGQVVENEVYEDAPLYAMVKKNKDFGGKTKPIPLITGVSQGVSADFATAQANQSPPQVNGFQLTRKRRYGLATIDNETMLASANDKMAFIEGSKLVIDSAIRATTLAIQSDLFRSGTGSIGQVNASGWTSGVATLMDTTTVTQFEINMVLQDNATDGGASPRAALGYVIAVDRTAGTVTVSSTGLGGAAGTPASWAASEYLLRQGDNNACCSGLAAWFPTTAPGSSDNFYGVNRSADPVRLAGVRFDGRNESVEEALIDAITLLGREGGKPTLGVCSFQTFGALVKSLGSKMQYTDAEAETADGHKIGFRGVSLIGGNTKASIFPDRSCPANLTYLLTPKTIAIEALGEVPQILMYEDGLTMLRVSNKDAGELRVGAYFNASCNAPGWNAVVQTSA